MSSYGSIMEMEIASTPSVFQSILDAKSQFDSVKNIISEKKIKFVLILARGTSDNAAHFLKYLIEVKMGLPCGLTSPSAVTIYNSKLHYDGTLVIAISQSGQSPDLVAFADAAKRSGGYLIAMTNDESSPLAHLAHHHLSLLAGPELAVAATKSYSAQLLVSYLLVSSWTGATVTGQEIVDQAEELVANTHINSAAVAASSRESEMLFLGRGFSYANAREAALKVQETSKLSVQGLSTADYLHGPISALRESTQLYIVAPHNMPANSISEALVKIRKHVDHITWIGEGGASSGTDIRISGSRCSDEITSSIIDAISLQGFALEFAKKFGFNPDSPEGLSKVTKTL
jgi:glutamine---fructose-6-phosphate transaminase (isomerizing)